MRAKRQSIIHKNVIPDSGNMKKIVGINVVLEQPANYIFIKIISVRVSPRLNQSVLLNLTR